MSVPRIAGLLDILTNASNFFSFCLLVSNRVPRGQLQRTRRTKVDLVHHLHQKVRYHHRLCLCRRQKLVIFKKSEMPSKQRYASDLLFTFQLLCIRQKQCRTFFLAKRPFKLKKFIFLLFGIVWIAKLQVQFQSSSDSLHEISY